MTATTTTFTLTDAERAAVGLAARRIHDAGPLTSPEFTDCLDSLLSVVATIATSRELQAAN